MGRGRSANRWTDTMNKTKWTDADFDSLSWHDNHVYGLSIREGSYGAGRLVLDLDYITEWRCGLDKRCSFMLAPAELAFDEVTDLKVGIDYRGTSMGPLSIGEIRRETIEETRRFGRYQWRIIFNFPASEITFIGAGFVQELRAAPVESSQQSLGWEERPRCCAVDVENDGRAAPAG
jgi:hypothetical protein